MARNTGGGTEFQITDEQTHDEDGHPLENAGAGNDGADPLLDDEGYLVDVDGNYVDENGEPTDEPVLGDDGSAHVDDGQGGDEGGQGNEGGLDPEALARIAGDESETVPYARFAAQNEELAELRGFVKSVADRMTQVKADPPPPVVPPFDLAGKLKERNEKLMEGDNDAATALDLEIEGHRQNVATATAEERVLATVTQRQTAREIELVIADGFARFPFMNDKLADGTANPDFDQEALDEVLMYRNHFHAKGQPIQTALANAIEKVGGQFEAVGDPPPQRGQPALRGIPGGKDNAPLPKAEAQRRVRNARADAAQPPRTSQTGLPNRERIDVTKIDVNNLSDADFDKLPPDVLAKLRGDR